MPEPYHPVTTQITNLLARNGCWFETFEHEAVRTSEQAAATREGYGLDQGAKALVVRLKARDKTNSFVMLVFPAHCKFDKAKVKKHFHAKDIRFASSEEIAQYTGGVLPGGIPPFGNLFGLPTFADPSLFEREKIVFNAGDRRFSVAMRSEDYRRLVEPEVFDIITNPS